MDWQAVDFGVWIGIALVTIPFAALAAFLVVYRRTPIIIDARLIDASRRKAFDRIADVNCGEELDEDLEEAFFKVAIDCAIEAYRVFNPESRISDKQLRKRFWAKVMVIGNSALVRIYFGKRLEGHTLEAMNVPINRELRLKRPADVAPNGGGIKTAPPPKPTPTRAQSTAPRPRAER